MSGRGWFGPTTGVLLATIAVVTQALAQAAPPAKRPTASLGVRTGTAITASPNTQRKTPPKPGAAVYIDDATISSVSPADLVPGQPFMVTVWVTLTTSIAQGDLIPTLKIFVDATEAKPQEAADKPETYKTPGGPTAGGSGKEPTGAQTRDKVAITLFAYAPATLADDRALLLSIFSTLDNRVIAETSIKARAVPGDRPVPSIFASRAVQALLGALVLLSAAAGWLVFRQRRIAAARIRALESAVQVERQRASAPGSGGVAEDRVTTPGAEGSSHPDRNQVFLSYSRQDEKLVDELKVHLSPILRKHNLSLWSDSSIEVGSDWRSDVSMAIARSRVALAVVSPDYLASEALQEYELPALMQAQERSALRLFWLPARPSAVESTALARYQGLLNPGQPLSTLAPQERGIALVTVAETLDRYLELAATDADKQGAPLRNTSAKRLPIRLEQVRLRNIRCFEDITLDFNATPLTGTDRLPSLRTVLVGDNATGKSTVLRSIALGMCDESGATALLKKMKGRMIRSGTQSGTIELQFRSDDSGDTFAVVTEISTSPSSNAANLAEIVRKSSELPPDIILVGYGTQRTRLGTNSHEHYDVATAVGTLFDDDVTLLNPELVILRQPRWIRKGMQDILAGILELQSDKVEYRSDALRIGGPWGQERVEVLSDGYRSTAQWVLDFMNWFVYAGDTTSSPNEVAGIVLVDELEQHLHPQWQRKIISRLRTLLPKVQFLITTHSPLIASSVTGLAVDGWREKLIHFGTNEEGKVVATESHSLRGMNVQQVLASPAFDYLIDAEPSVAATFAEASRLASKADQRTPEEEKRYQEVKRIVGEILSNQDTTLVEREARADLEQQQQARLQELEAKVFGETR